MHKSGFVNIVGNPNVGKSTLMNALVGERMSIITNKSQTTRHRIMGIVSGEDFQIVYSDTPGVLRPNYKLQEEMLAYSKSALSDADVLLYVTDVLDNPDKNANFVEMVNANEAPVLLVINKIDLIDVESGVQTGAVTADEVLAEMVEKWKERIPRAEVLPVSALHKANLDMLLKRIKELLPEGPSYFDEDQLTDRPARFFVTEIIREKILQNYEKEIPYSVEAVVESFKEEKGMLNIEAVIYCEREGQKGILIGKGGTSLKRVGMQARKDIETFFDKKVYLKLLVKVEKDWRNKESKLKNFGYMNS